MNLLCRIGLHAPAYQPVPYARTGWTQVPNCTRCGQPLPHRRR